MRLQIIKIFSFWAAFTFVVNIVIENMQSEPAPMSNIQLTKPTVVKVKAGKAFNAAHYSQAKGKRVAMK
jgi:hypothetical protein